MSSALIGYTGFVGSNLAASSEFDLLINRANLESLKGARLDRLVCAGLPAAKWLINQNPDEDVANMRRLESVLATVQAESVVLISTIDVYPCTQGADETFDLSGQANHPYGRHRFQFERFIRETFPTASVVRLPALFGRGLKKNILYDLLRNNRLERINPESRFQWYPLARLREDLGVVESHRLPLINLFSEPVETRAILQEFFPDKVVGQLADPRADYDLATRHGALFASDSRYVMGRSDVLSAMRAFVDAERLQQ